MYGNIFFFANHTWDQDLRWEHKTQFSTVTAGDAEEEEDDE
jgi:hypothetical protein